MTVEKNSKVITQTNHSAMKQFEFLTMICNLLNAPEKSRLQDEISFGFASHWLENWCGIMEPITKRSGTLRSQLMARAVPIR